MAGRDSDQRLKGLRGQEFLTQDGLRTPLLNYLAATTITAAKWDRTGGWMSTQAGTSLPAIARYWWLTALRGLVALILALGIALAGHTTGRLVTYVALFWMTSGLITLRFALAIRPRPGFRLGLAAAIVAVVGAVLLLLRDRLSGLVEPDVFIWLLGISAVLTGLLRMPGGFAAEERLGHRWTLGGIVLGTLEVALGALLLLTNEVDPGLLAPIAAAWSAVSGTLLLAQGLRLRRLARGWQAAGTSLKDP
jgi:uncharacterized membrane protein HdeD (DUF308 family)